MWRLCCPCSSAGGDDDGGSAEAYDSAVRLSTHARCRSGDLVATAHTATGAGQVLAEQTVLQDKAYWEVTVERLGSDSYLSLGVASNDHALGDALGNNRTTWVWSSGGGNPLRAGDVVGVSLDQSDFPVALRFYVNGGPCAELRGPSAEPTPILQLSGDDDSVQVNFGSRAFAHPRHGFDGIIRSRNIL